MDGVNDFYNHHLDDLFLALSNPNSTVSLCVMVPGLPVDCNWNPFVQILKVWEVFRRHSVLFSLISLKKQRRNGSDREDVDAFCMSYASLRIIVQLELNSFLAHYTFSPQQRRGWKQRCSDIRCDKYSFLSPGVMHNSRSRNMSGGGGVGMFISGVRIFLHDTCLIQ